MSVIDEVYIKEWLALQNIVTHKYGKKYLEKSNETDECEQWPNDICNKKIDCDIYKSETQNSIKCVSKSRIKHFMSSDVSPRIIGKNQQYYKLISSVKFNGTIHYKNNVVNIYYYMFLSEETNHIYILFPTGYIFDKNYIETNNDLKKFINDLRDKILNHQMKPNQKIIICGHSLGCVLSLYTAMALKAKNEDFFNSNIIIIGSAPFKYSKNEDFNYLTNVKIFAIGLKLENTVYVDCFLYKGPDGLNNYKPLTYIIQTGSSLDTYETYIDEIEIIPVPIVSNDYCEMYHNWKNYYDFLIKKYPFDKKGGKYRSSKKRCKYRSRKQKRTNIRTVKHNNKTRVFL
jgi:hypothetical protein